MGKTSISIIYVEHILVACVILIDPIIKQAYCFKLVYMHFMTTDNELIKFGQNRISQMASGRHVVTGMHIFVILCPTYELLIVISFAIHTCMSALL